MRTFFARRESRASAWAICLATCFVGSFAVAQLARVADPASMAPASAASASRAAGSVAAVSPGVPPSAASLSDADVASARQSIVALLSSEQRSDGRWEGAFETTPVSDALMLAYGRLLKMDMSAARTDALNSLSSQFVVNSAKDGGSGWPLYPGGHRDKMLTAQIIGALTYARETDYLKERGLPVFTKLSVDQAKKLSWIARMHLAPLGLIPNEAMPDIPMMMLGLQSKTGFSWPNVGPTGRGILAYTLWINLKKAIDDGDGAEFLDEHSDTIERTLRTLSRTEGRDGTWYFLTETLLSLAVFHAAEQAGLERVDGRPIHETIARAWQGLLGWRAKTQAGTFSLQPMPGSVWDTALVSVALSEDSSGANVSPLLVQSGAWLQRTQLIYPEDSPLYNEIGSGGWSFHHQDIGFPDVDDTAAVLGSLMMIDQKTTAPIDWRVFQNGLYWVLNRQNHDGGFAVFTKNIAQWPMKLATMFFDIDTLYKDTSQSDITSRVVIMLNHLMHDPYRRERLGSYFSVEQIRSAAEDGCDFVRSSSEHISGARVRLWHGDWFRNYIYGTSFSIQALLRDVCHPSAHEVDPYIKWFIDVQNADGGWGEGNDSYASRRFSRGESALETTEFALIPLIDYVMSKRIPESDPQRVRAQAAIDAGIQYLLRETQNGTVFHDTTYFAVIFKDQWYGRYDYVPTYGMLHVLNSWVEMKAELAGAPAGPHL